MPNLLQLYMEIVFCSFLGSNHYFFGKGGLVSGIGGGGRGGGVSTPPLNDNNTNLSCAIYLKRGSVDIIVYLKLYRQ